MALTRRRLVVLASAAVLLVLGALAAVVVVSVTRTQYGRDVIRDYLENTVAKRINGRLYVGRIRGGLLTGVTIDSLEIRGPDDSVFVATGRITIEYDPRDLLDQRVLLSRLEVERPVINVTKHENGEWNFRRIFPRGAPKAPKVDRGFGDFVVIDSAVVRDGALTLRMPWHPPDSITGAQRVALVDSVLRGTTQETVRGPEGFVRAWRWRHGDLALSHVRLADPDSAGRFFRIADLDVEESYPPFRFSDVRGDVRWLGDSVWLDVAHFDLPGSTGHASGKVVWGSDLPTRYDVRVVGDSVSLRDVAWVYPTLPRTGGGRMKLHIRNSPEDLDVIDYAISEMDVRSTGSRLQGRMTYGVGGTVLVVKDVDLRADPVDFRLIRQLNGQPFPYPWAGTITGRVRARGGPVTDFVVDGAEFVFRDANVRGATTIGSARGTLDILYPAFTRFKGFRVHAAQLDLRTLQYLNPNFARLNGYVAGTATLDSSWLDVRFRDADLRHIDGPGEASAFTGRGRVTWGEQFLTYDLDLEASALAFTTIAQSYPALPLRGTYRGPIRVRGTMENLDLATALTGPGGTLAVSGNFDLYPDGYRARARAGLTNVDLNLLLDRPSVPASNLTMRLDVDLAGDSLRNLAGVLGVEVDRSTIDRTRLHPSTARLAFGDGRVRVDSLRLESTAATVLASGAIGLSPGRRDTLALRVLVDSLGGLRQWLVKAPETRLASAGEAVAAPSVDSLAGSLRLMANVIGSIDTLALVGTVTGRHLHHVESSARVLAAAFDLSDVTRVPRGVATLHLDTVRANGVGVRSMATEVRLLDRGLLRFRGGIASATGPTVALLGGARIVGDTSAVTLDSLTVAVEGNRWVLAAPVHLLSTREGTAIDSLVLRGSRGGRLALRARVPVAEPVDVLLVATDFPVGDLGQLLQSRAELRGAAQLEWRIEGERASPRMRFSAGLANARIGDVSLERLGASGSYADRRLAATLSLFHQGSPALRANASLPIDLSLVPVARRLLDEPLSASMRADSVSLGIIEAFSPALRRATGTLSSNVSVSGTWRQPRLRGGVTIVDGAVGLSNLGIRVDRVFADVALSGDSVLVRRLSARSGRSPGDTISLTGVVDLHDWSDLGFDLRLHARDFHAMGRPRVADIVVSTPSRGLHLRGRESRSELEGGIIVTRGDLFIPEVGQKRVVSLDDPELMRLVDTSVFANRTLLPDAPPRLLRGLALDNVQLAMGDDVWLRSAEASIKLGGAVNVRTVESQADGGETQLALDGVLTAERGTYRLLIGGGAVARTFVVEEMGTLRFFGEPDLNPTLDIKAVHTIRQLSQQDARQDVRIEVHIGGTLARPVLELSSPDRRLSQSDLISYLVTGQPSFEVAQENASGYANLAGNVLLPSFGSLLSSRLGGGFIDVIDVSTAGTEQGLFGGRRVDRQIGRTLLSGTRLGVGKQIGNRTFLSANAGVCQFGNLTRNFEEYLQNPTELTEWVGLKVETRLNHGFSLALGSEPSTNALLCANPNAALNTRGFVPTPRQYGFDLFKTWQF